MLKLTFTYCEMQNIDYYLLAIWYHISQEKSAKRAGFRQAIFQQHFKDKVV